MPFQTITGFALKIPTPSLICFQFYNIDKAYTRIPTEALHRSLPAYLRSHAPPTIDLDARPLSTFDYWMISFCRKYMTEFEIILPSIFSLRLFHHPYLLALHFTIHTLPRVFPFGWPNMWQTWTQHTHTCTEHWYLGSICFSHHLQSSREVASQFLPHTSVSVAIHVHLQSAEETLSLIFGLLFCNFWVANLL